MTPPPTLKYLTEIDVERIKLNPKPYENMKRGFTYHYLNYDGINGLQIQLPMFLISNTGIKRWDNEGGPSFTSLLQFPCMDSSKFYESGEACVLGGTLPLLFDNKKKDFRERTQDEVDLELQCFRQFCLIEKRVRRLGEVSDDLRAAQWKGVIQVRRRDEGGFHPPSIKLHVPTMKEDRSQCDIICRNEVTNDLVGFEEIPPASTMCPVFTLGRMFKKKGTDPVEFGLHFYMQRVTFMPAIIVLNRKEDIKEKQTDFLPTYQQATERRANDVMPITTEA